MDERNFPNENQHGKQPASGFDSYYPGTNPRQGEFKVNIEGYDNQPPAYQPQNAAQTPRRPQQGRPMPQPQGRQTPMRTGASQQRPAAQRPAATQRPAANRPAGTQQRVPAQGQQRPAAAGKSAAPTRQPAKKANGKKRKMPLTAEQKAKRKARRVRRFLIFLSVLICISIITATVSATALSTINDILAINKDGSSSVSVVIPEGSGFDDVYGILCDSGLIKQKMLCKLFLQFRHYDKYYNRKLGKEIDVHYEPGVYYFETDATLEEMMEEIKNAGSTSKDTVRLTFPEGWTIAKIFERIEKYNVCTAEKLYANLDIVGGQYAFYKRIPANSGRYLKAEGYLFPDTYEFFIGESANSVLKKLFENFENKWKKEYSQKAKAIGMSMDQVLTLASIIQREAKDSSQMKDISSVLHNRLRDSATYPQLQMNSTKEYITAVNEYGLFNEVYYSIYLDAYNTYNVNGLPPGPICNPGVDAIEAALEPNETNYHFFCHDAQGEVYYASTAEEHQRNTEKVLFDK